MNAKWITVICPVLISLLSATAMAQQTPTNDVTTELELGAIFTTGNAENENVNYSVVVDWLRNDWEYQFSTEGLRASQDTELTAQRLYHFARARQNLSESSYWVSRVAYEDDRFSGYDYQADATVSYGRSMLQNIDNMSLDADIGVGYRKSVSEEDTFNEAIIRLAGEYEWGVSETATFFQDLSIEAGEETSIFRSQTGVESQVLDSVVMRVSLEVKHQTEVPVGRKKTDTATVISLVWNF